MLSEFLSFFNIFNTQNTRLSICNEEQFESSRLRLRKKM